MLQLCSKWSYSTMHAQIQCTHTHSRARARAHTHTHTYTYTRGKGSLAQPIPWHVTCLTNTIFPKLRLRQHTSKKILNMFEMSIYPALLTKSRQRLLMALQLFSVTRPRFRLRAVSEAVMPHHIYVYSTASMTYQLFPGRFVT